MTVVSVSGSETNKSDLKQAEESLLVHQRQSDCFVCALGELLSDAPFHDAEPREGPIGPRLTPIVGC